MKYGIERRPYGGDRASSNIYHVGYTKVSSNIQKNERLVFDGRMLTRYVADGHQDVIVQLEMLVRPGDSVEDCAEVVAEGVIPLDTILYGKEFQTQQVDPVTGEHSIHVRCAELKLIPTQSWKKYLNENFDSDNTKIGATLIGATLMIGVVDDGHVDHFKLSSLLSARSHRRQHTYTLRVNGTPSGGSSLYCDGDYEDTVS